MRRKRREKGRREKKNERERGRGRETVERRARAPRGRRPEKKMSTTEALNAVLFHRRAARLVAQWKVRRMGAGRARGVGLGSEEGGRC